MGQSQGVGRAGFLSRVCRGKSLSLLFFIFWRLPVFLGLWLLPPLSKPAMVHPWPFFRSHLSFSQETFSAFKVCVTQNSLPISRSITFIIRRLLCHVFMEIWTWTSLMGCYSAYHSTLARIFLRFIHVVVCVSSLFFLLSSSGMAYKYITVVCPIFC